MGKLVFLPISLGGDLLAGLIGKSSSVWSLGARAWADLGHRSAPSPDAAPRALDHKAQLRYLRAVQARSSPRDRALALVPFYAGARIAKTVALDVDDVRLSARKGILRIYGKGERVREVPIHPELRTALTDWLEERRWAR